MNWDIFETFEHCLPSRIEVGEVDSVIGASCVSTERVFVGARAASDK